MRMRTFYLFANPVQPAGPETAARVFSRLIDSGARVLCEPWLAQKLSGAVSTELSALPEETEALISIGGDGTLLRAASHAAQIKVPMLGIHTGTIGFLMEASAANAETAVDLLLRGHYAMEERSLLACICEGNRSLALNDCCISRGNNPGVLSISVFADGDKVYDLTGDGVLVSTPTGCTAYSLSAGGPILRPDVPCTLITPLCARQLLAKPVLLPASAKITLRASARGHGGMRLSLDGQRESALKENTDVTIETAPERALFIRFDKTSFFDQLREKFARWNHF